jgi:hypothetical protein
MQARAPECQATHFNYSLDEATLHNRQQRMPRKAYRQTSLPRSARTVYIAHQRFPFANRRRNATIGALGLNRYYTPFWQLFRGVPPWITVTQDAGALVEIPGIFAFSRLKRFAKQEKLNACNNEDSFVSFS